MQHTAYPIWETFTNRYSYTLAFSQSSIKSYASYSLHKNSSIEISSIGFIGTMQPFTLFDNLLFRQILYDIPGVFCGYGSSNWFSRRVDEEFVKARTQLKKELGEIGNRSTISLGELPLLLAIGLQLTFTLDIAFLTFKKWTVLILARI